MPHPIEPSLQHFEDAFARMHKAEWPVHSLAELSHAARLYGLVSGSAHRLANGHQLVTTEAEVAGPITNPRPARAAPPRAAGPTYPHRRRDDDGVDMKRRAAGDRDD
ncbi:MAG: hypothetical protein EOP35_19205 [Rubrivivax sp.]|nr:MAG: hypothetical protein EOP35_19205 [Rubrivivax sp.]